MNKLNIIVPYRNREEHKNSFVDLMFKFLSNSGPDNFRIYIIEQSDEQEFNKGILLNIGFLETYDGNHNYYCFNDVDTLPRSAKAKYSKPPANTIIHPYGHFHALSNFMIIRSETFKKMNGFSNKYWNWGFEDDDFLLRAYLNEVKVSRENFTERFKSEIYYELDVQNNSHLAKKMNKSNTNVNQILFYNTILNPNLSKKEGLNTVDYKIIKTKKYKKYTLIQCQINNLNRNIDFINLLEDYSTYLNPNI